MVTLKKWNKLIVLMCIITLTSCTERTIDSETNTYLPTVTFTVEEKTEFDEMVEDVLVDECVVLLDEWNELYDEWNIYKHCHVDSHSQIAIEAAKSANEIAHTYNQLIQIALKHNNNLQELPAFIEDIPIFD